MFVQYFNFSEQPFGATPDPRFLFQSAAHREALASLYCAFYGNRGFTTLIAEPGMGKTTLLFEFMHHIRERARTVFLFNTLCDPSDLLSLILRDLDITPKQSAADQYQQLNEVLAAEARAGRRFVLIIDEAQNLSTRALEAVRLLTNFETPRAKLMQIVLAGQPQLADKLAMPEVIQLRQRVSTLCTLSPLSGADISAYIQHRLLLAGCARPHLFTPAAVHLVAEASRGIPRVINTLCFNALCLCRARNASQVDEDMVAEVIHDLQLPVTALPTPAPRLEPIVEVPFTVAPSDPAPRNRLLLFAAALLICISAAGFGLRLWDGRMNVQTRLFFSRIFAAAPHQAMFGAVNAKVQAAEAIEPPTAMPAEPRTAKSTAVTEGNVQNPLKVTILPGDTLQSIATNHVGSFDPTVLKKILQLNPNLADPNLIKTGRIILLPGPGDLARPNGAPRTNP